MLYVLDTWGSVIIALTGAFQPMTVASLRPLLKVQVGRISISAYLAMTQDIRKQRITGYAGASRRCIGPNERGWIDRAKRGLSIRIERTPPSGAAAHSGR